MWGKRRGGLAAGLSAKEVVVVLAVLGLLVGLVTVNVRNYRTWSRQEAARTDIGAIVEALKAFRALNARFPTCEEGLIVLSWPSGGGNSSVPDDGPVDPWGRPYRYETPGVSGPFAVISLGADGCVGGEGGNADISSDDLP